jgi:hypothetical protein
MEQNNQNTSSSFLVFEKFLEEISEKVSKEVIAKISENYLKKQIPSTWISTEEAMSLLRLKSKTSLQKIRDSGLIEIAKPLGNKIILYNYQSIIDFIESKKTF